MDSRKIIIGCYLAASTLVWFLVRSLIQWLNFSFYQIRKLPAIDVLREALPLAGLVLTFIVLLKHPKVNEVMDEVVAELKKVTWPNPADVRKATVVVMVCILVASGILAFFDLLFGKVVGFLLS